VKAKIRGERVGFLCTGSLPSPLFFLFAVLELMRLANQLPDNCASPVSPLQQAPAKRLLLSKNSK
jgi:hypothetical protein